MLIIGAGFAGLCGPIETNVDENRIKRYFLAQIQSLIERGASDSDGFLAYFAGHNPRDEEILGLLAIQTMLSGKYRLADRFPAPAEALAALSYEARAEICRAFRDQIKQPQQSHLSAA